PWLIDIEPIEPPARVWPRIGQRLGWQAEPASSGLRGSLPFWRAAAALAALVAVVAIWALLQRPPQSATMANQPAGQAVMTLLHDDGTPGWLVSIDQAHDSVLVVPVPAQRNAQGRVPE